MLRHLFSDTVHILFAVAVNVLVVRPLKHILYLFIAEGFKSVYCMWHLSHYVVPRRF